MTLEQKPSTPAKRSWYSVSLRGLLTLMTITFVIGYQQFQIRQLGSRLDEVKKEQAARTAARSQPRTIFVKAPKVTGSGRLLFAPEVEEAMMGDAVTPAMPIVRPR